MSVEKGEYHQETRSIRRHVLHIVLVCIAPLAGRGERKLRQGGSRAVPNLRRFSSSASFPLPTKLSSGRCPNPCEDGGDFELYKEVCTGWALSTI